MAADIEKVDADRLLNTPVEDLAAYFAEKYKITVPTLDIDSLVVDQREKQIDVSRDPMRMIMDRGRPFYVTGTEIEVEVPFTGEAEAFKIQPNPYTLSPPPRVDPRLGLDLQRGRNQPGRNPSACGD